MRNLTALATGLGFALLAACGPATVPTDEAGLYSAISESGWRHTCVNPERVPAPGECEDRQVLWVLELTRIDNSARIYGNLGAGSNAMRVTLDLETPVQISGEQMGSNFFAMGRASASVLDDGTPSIHLSSAQVLGFQTASGGPKQGVMADGMTMAEFGRYCLLAPQEIYNDQCDGRRVIWFGAVRATAHDGIMLGLPFQNATLARVKTIEPLTWPIGDTSNLANQPVVVTGIMGPFIERREGGERVPVINDARIISFPRSTQSAEDITGVR